MIRRFGLAYFSLYALASPVFSWAWPKPSGELPAPHAMTRLVTWVADRAGAAPLVYEPTSLDRTFDWIQCAILLVLAAGITAASIVVRRPDGGEPRVAAWLRFVLRASLAAVMLGYGFQKVFPVQFGDPSLVRLMQPVGTLPLPTLLFTALGASPAFRVVVGLIEVLAAWLLIAPQTWRLGALLMALVSAAVVTLNVTYDITDKLFTLHLCAMALWLGVPDIGRVGRLLLGQVVAPAEPGPPLFRHAAVARAAAVATTLWVLYVSGVHASSAFVAWRVDRDIAAHPHPLRAVWVADGAPAEDRWQYLVLESLDASATAFDGTVTTFVPRVNSTARTLALQRYEGDTAELRETHEFAWILEGDRLTLQRSGRAWRFRRLTDAALVLRHQRFRWVQQRRARGQ